MSDDATADIDPRFDPRFQRGYSGDASSTTDVAAAKPQAVVRVPDPPASAAEATAAPRIEPMPHAVPSASEGGARTSTPDGREPRTADWFGDVGPEAVRRVDPYIVAAWAVSAAAVVFGAALYWAGLSGQSYYGPSNENDLLLQTAAWLVAPPLMQVGLLSLVAMLVWSGVRHARTRRVRHDRDADHAAARDAEAGA